MTLPDDRTAAAGAIDDRLGRAAFSGLVGVLHALKRSSALSEEEIDSVAVSVLLNFGRSDDPHPDAALVRDVLRPLVRPSALADAGLRDDTP